jgi:hypothetical protein
MSEALWRSAPAFARRGGFFLPVSEELQFLVDGSPFFEKFRDRLLAEYLGLFAGGHYDSSPFLGVKPKKKSNSFNSSISEELGGDFCLMLRRAAGLGHVAKPGHLLFDLPYIHFD